MTVELHSTASEVVVDLRAELQAFKSWVHAWLDAHGVPKEFPDGPHTREGCRIGDRMDWLLARITECDDLRRRLEAAVIEKATLQLRIDTAVVELDRIADLLADSEDLLVEQTGAVRLLNEVLEALAGMPRNKGD